MYLFIILVFVILYKFYSVKEGFYHSINPCFDKNTPYIEFDNMYVCFDVKNKIEDTINVFYGKDKQCYIDPKNTTMTLYQRDGTPIEVIKEKGNKICKPYKVNVE